MIIPKIGDEVWVAYRARGKAPPQKGVVSQIFDFEDRKTREMKTMVVVYRIARGQIGEKIFFSEDEAWEAYLKEMKRRGRLPLPREGRERMVGKEKSPGGLEKRSGGKRRKERKDSVDQLLEMFNAKCCQRANDGRDDGYDEIQTALLFLILFRLDNLGKLLCIFGGGLLGVIITSLLLR